MVDIVNVFNTNVAVSKFSKNDIIVISKFNVDLVICSSKNESVLKFYPLFFKFFEVLTEDDAIGKIIGSSFDENQKVRFWARCSSKTHVPWSILQPEIWELIHPFVA